MAYIYNISYSEDKSRIINSRLVWDTGKVQGQHSQNWEIWSEKGKIKTGLRGGNLVVDYFPGMYESLDSIASNIHKILVK